MLKIIKIVGTVEIQDGIDKKKDIKILLTAEQNSYVIGELCNDGISQSIFMTENYW